MLKCFPLLPSFSGASELAGQLKTLAANQLVLKRLKVMVKCCCINDYLILYRRITQPSDPSKSTLRTLSALHCMILLYKLESADPRKGGTGLEVQVF